MADAADFAGPLVQNWTDELVAAIRARVVVGTSAVQCLSCDEEIPEGRRAAVPGCVRCTWCQDLADRGRA